jgi:hypothetical protein
MESYQFTKTPVNIERLAQEIQASSITIALDHITTLGAAITIYFKAALNTDEQTILGALVTDHTGEALPPTAAQVEIVNVDVTSTEKAQKVATTKLEGSSSTLVSHDFCDKTTWWGQSTRITQETLTTSDNLTYSSVHQFWIDLVSGKIPYEDRISAAYKALIYVDDVLTTTGFVINYVTGAVVFDSSQEGKVVKAAYSYAGGSLWKVAPTAGKTIKMLGTQIKLTDDCTLSSGHIYFQPFLTNGTPAGTATVYKNLNDLIKCVSGAVSRIQKFGNMAKDIITMDYEYITSKDLKYSQGVEIRIWINGDQPISGTSATMIAHIVSLNE